MDPLTHSGSSPVMQQRSVLKQENPFNHVKELSETHHNAKLKRARLQACTGRACASDTA